MHLHSHLRVSGSDKYTTMLWLLVICVGMSVSTKEDRLGGMHSGTDSPSASHPGSLAGTGAMTCEFAE